MLERERKKEREGGRSELKWYSTFILSTLLSLSLFLSLMHNRDSALFFSKKMVQKNLSSQGFELKPLDLATAP